MQLISLFNTMCATNDAATAGQSPMSITVKLIHWGDTVAAPRHSA